MERTRNKREEILEAAERSVLSKGFDATSIEEIVAETGITKGGFFYHFKDKNALARALLERSIEIVAESVNEIEKRARDLTDDPLQCVLIILKLLAEGLTEPDHPFQRSLISAIVYQERLFDRTIVERMRELLLDYEDRRLSFFEQIAEVYDMSDDVDLEHVSAMFNTVFEGAIVHARATARPEAQAQQILLYRSYLKLLFANRKDR